MHVHTFATFIYRLQIHGGQYLTYPNPKFGMKPLVRYNSWVSDTPGYPSHRPAPYPAYRPGVVLYFTQPFGKILSPSQTPSCINTPCKLAARCLCSLDTHKIMQTLRMRELKPGRSISIYCMTNTMRHVFQAWALLSRLRILKCWGYWRWPRLAGGGTNTEHRAHGWLGLAWIWGVFFWQPLTAVCLQDAPCLLPGNACY